MYTQLKISEAKKIIKDKLDLEILSLPESERLITEYPLSIEEYKLNHPRGALLIVYKGSDFQKSKVEGFQIQPRDLQIGIIAVIKKNNGSKDPEEYVDFIKDSLTGIEIQVEREEKKTYPVKDEWLKEESGEWWYAVTIIVPTMSIEKKILDHQ